MSLFKNVSLYSLCFDLVEQIFSLIRRLLLIIFIFIFITFAFYRFFVLLLFLKRLIGDILLGLFVFTYALVDVI